MAELDTRRQDDDRGSDPVMKDPFTGTTPTGPISAGSARTGRGNWGLAARWFMLALLLLLVVMVVAYLM